MTDYIITEEELLDTRSYIYHEDEEAFIKIERNVRSHPYQSERDKVLDVGGILESLCKTDLYWYNKGVTEGEDVGKCRGKDCNYCGRYNEKLRQQAGEP